jgi:DNA-binding transcriptional LysR family regulator
VAIALVQKGLEKTRALARGTAGSLRVGFTSTTRVENVSHVIDAFETDHPDCEVVEREVPLMDPWTALRENEIDALCNWLTGVQPDLTIGPIIDRQERVLAVAADHPLAASEAVSVEDLGGQGVSEPAGLCTELWDAIVPRATPSGVPIPRTARVSTANEIFALVARGKIVHPTVRSTASLYPREGVSFVPIRDMAPLSLAIVWVTANENARIRAFASSGARLTSAIRDRRLRRERPDATCWLPSSASRTRRCSRGVLDSGPSAT